MDLWVDWCPAVYLPWRPSTISDNCDKLQNLENLLKKVCTTADLPVILFPSNMHGKGTLAARELTSSTFGEFDTCTLK